jgi:beta-lactamase regulating signal transducer with metallopeptidase domain
MNDHEYWRSVDPVLIWGFNILVQLTMIYVVTLIIVSFLQRAAAVRYGILCVALAFALLSPLTALFLERLTPGWMTLTIAHPPQTPSDLNVPSNFEQDSLQPKSANRISATPDRAIMADAKPRSDLNVQDHPEPNRTTADARHFELVAAKAITIPNPDCQNLAETTAWAPFYMRRGMLAILLIWFAGALLRMIRLSVAWMRLTRILLQAQPHPERIETLLNRSARSIDVELLTSDQVTGPMAAGLWRPCVVLPKSLIQQLDSAQLQQILTHELAHVSRRDQVVVLLQNVLAAMAWIHPLTSVLNRHLSQAREEICDNHVLQSTDAPSYCRTLLQLTQWIQPVPPVPGAVGLFTSRWRLEDRVARLLDHRAGRGTQLRAIDRAGIVAVTLLLISVVSVGTVRLAVASPDEPGQGAKPRTNNSNAESDTDASATGARQVDRKPSNEKASMTMRGKLTNSQGLGIAKASIVVTGFKPANDGGQGAVLAEGVSDPDGQFQLKFAADIATSYIEQVAIAHADGMAIAWQEIDWEHPQAAIVLTLLPQQRIEVRLIDKQGQPAADASVDIVGLLSRPKSGEKGEKDSLWLQDLARPLPIIPKLISDADGRLSIPAVAEGHGVFLRVRGTERYAPQFVHLNTGWPEERSHDDGTYRGTVKNIPVNTVGTVTLASATPFSGVVLLGDSDKPAANARLTIWSRESEGSSMSVIEGKTDDAGRFHLNPNAGVQFGISAFPPDGAPYLPRESRDLSWSAETATNLEIRLPAAFIVEGTILDAKSGQPLPGASVQYHPERFNNKSVPENFVDGWQAMKVADEKGHFQITVPPGPGTLLFHAPIGANYVLQERGLRVLNRGLPGGIRYYAHAFQQVNPTGEASDARTKELSDLKIALQPGGTVTARLVDEAGQPIPQAIYTSSLNIAPASPFYRAFAETAEGGRAMLTGLAPGKQYRVYFLATHSPLGATAVISLDDPAPTITLRRCASASVRFLNPDGTPVGNGRLYGFNLVVSPGVSPHAFRTQPAELAADEDFLVNFDRRNYGRAHATNADGVLEMPVLIPGATYRFHNFGGEAPPSVEKEFIAESGRNHELGDIRLRSVD